MKYRALEADHSELALLREELLPLIEGMGFFLAELNLFRQKPRHGVSRAQVRAVIAARQGEPLGTGELAQVHRALLPRLELFLSGAADSAGGRPVPPDISVEVSSPGLDRQIKEGAEFRCYLGQELACYRSDLSSWETGVLTGAGGEGIELKAGDGAARFIPFTVIGKAKLRG
jgi:ribosome maturation factor RimP